MELDVLLDLVRAEVQHPPTRAPRTLEKLTPAQREAFRTMRRRIRRERAAGRRLSPPVGSLIWL